MVLLGLCKRSLWRGPPHRDVFQSCRERGDTISLEWPKPRAIAEVGEARPSRSGRVMCNSRHKTRVISSASEEFCRLGERASWAESTKFLGMTRRGITTVDSGRAVMAG